jgi:hypothetical protein
VFALLVVIGADGVPTAIETANKIASPLDKAALTAVQLSQFAPGSLNGNLVPTRLIGWVPFLGKGHTALPVTGPASTLKNFDLKVTQAEVTVNDTKATNPLSCEVGNRC